MDELDDRRRLDVRLALIAQRTRRQQHQHRAQSLATRRNDVLANLVDQQHIGSQPMTDQSIDG